MAVANNEMTIKDTVQALVPFFIDCVNYWEGCGKEMNEAVECALKDMENIKCDPFSPSGAYLHDSAKHIVIEWFRDNFKKGL